MNLNSVLYRFRNRFLQRPELSDLETQFLQYIGKYDSWVTQQKVTANFSHRYTSKNSASVMSSRVLNNLKEKGMVEQDSIEHNQAGSLKMNIWRKL